MIGDTYIVLHDCKAGSRYLSEGDILTETAAYNYETEEYEEGGEHNCLCLDGKFFICEVGSDFTKEHCMKHIPPSLIL